LNSDRAERRLAAILAADVAGYSRLMGEDEEATLAALKAMRRRDRTGSVPRLSAPVLPASYAHSGQLDAAHRALDRWPAAGVSYLRRAEDRELLLSGLRLAKGETACTACPRPAASRRSIE